MLFDCIFFTQDEFEIFLKFCNRRKQKSFMIVMKCDERQDQRLLLMFNCVFYLIKLHMKK